MILAIGIYNRGVPVRRVVLNLTVVYLANFMGCLLATYLFAYVTDLFKDEPYITYVRQIAVQKTRSYGWGNLLLRSIPANTLVRNLICNVVSVLNPLHAPARSRQFIRSVLLVCWVSARGTVLEK